MGDIINDWEKLQNANEEIKKLKTENINLKSRINLTKEFDYHKIMKTVYFLEAENNRLKKLLEFYNVKY